METMLGVVGAALIFGLLALIGLITALVVLIGGFCVGIRRLISFFRK